MNATIADATQFGAAALRDRPDAGVDAMRLLECALNRGRGWIVAHGDARLQRDDVRRFVALLRQARTGKPLAYVTGEIGFYRRTFACDERALVPRPETELLVERALQLLRDVEAPRVLDVGSGSGAIACTIAAERPDARVVATDCSTAALALASDNARRLGVEDRCAFIWADLVPAPDLSSGSTVRYDAVIANLPYVPSDDIPPVPEPLGFEPREALDGGADGLAAYRRFVPMAPAVVAPGGVLLLEAAPAQMPGLAALAAEAFGPQEVAIGRDLAGLERYVEVQTAAR